MTQKFNRRSNESDQTVNNSGQTKYMYCSLSTQQIKQGIIMKNQTTQQLPPHPNAPKSVTSNKQRRRVEFSEEHVVIPPRFLVLTEPLSRAMWYTGKDFQRFRAKVGLLASEIRYGKSERSKDLPSYSSVLSSVHLSCSRGSDPNKSSVFQLALWFNVATNRRGLEHLSCTESMVFDRKVRINSAIDSVLGAQALGYNDNNDRVENIRRVYERISKPARFFALSLARASELASHEVMSTLRIARRYDANEDTAQQLIPQKKRTWKRFFSKQVAVNP